MRSSSSDSYRPKGARDLAVDTRLRRFAEMNSWIMARGGWVTSIPGAITLTFDVRAGSPVVAELRDAGYDVNAEECPGQRILPNGSISTVHRFSFQLL